jgi:putative peptidoglycan lipid II flippase
MTKSKKKLILNLLTVFAVVFLSKIIGFVREIMYGSRLGITSVSDNFVMAQTIPYTLYAIVTQAFKTTYIPNLFEVTRKEGKCAGEKYTGNFLVVVEVVSIAFLIALVLFAEPLTKIFAAGFSEKDLAQTIYMTRFMAVTVLFSGVTDVLNGYLQSAGYYSIGASLTIFSNGIFCIFLFLYPCMGVSALLVGTISSKLLELMIIAGAVCFHRMKVSFKTWKYWRYVVRALENSLFVLLGSVISEVGNLVDKRFACNLKSGTVSGLNYAHKIQIMIVQLFTATIGAVIFPELSRIATDKEGFTKVLNKGLIFICILMIPITAATIVLPEEIVAVLFERGVFGSDAVKMTSQCLIFYAVGMTFVVGYEFLSKACFAMHDTKTPIVMSAFGMFVNVSFNVLLIERFKHQGLAFATSLSMIIAFLGVLYVLNRKYRIINADLVIGLIQICLAAVVMCITLHFMKLVPLHNKYLQMAMFVVFGILIYLLALVIFGCKEVYEIKNLLRDKISRKR